MGHQESLLFCATKSDMIKLCNVLNRAAADSSELGLEYVGLDVYEVARLNRGVSLSLPPKWKTVQSYPAGTYFVWWGGERSPQRDDAYLRNICGEKDPYWQTVFAEYVVSATEMLEDLPQEAPNTILENEWMRTFQPKDNQIDIDLIEQL